MYDIVYLSQHENLHGFNSIKDKWPHARCLVSTADMIEDIRRAQSMCFTEMFWLVSDEVHLPDDADLSRKPEIWDKSYVHGWCCVTSDGAPIDGVFGVWLIPSKQHIDRTSLGNIKTRHDWINVAKALDVFFISYNEPNADENFLNLAAVIPSVQRVDGIDGIHNAHRRCAELASTSMFYTVDADTVINKDWTFSFVPSWYDRSYLHLWYSRNPVNDLEYGWGGIKLWPRHAVLHFNKSWLDFTTTVGNIKIMPDTISTSRFNTDGLSAWRSGFREAVKLASNIANDAGDESIKRLHAWMNRWNPKADHAELAVNGARSGYQYYLDNRHDYKALMVINDFAALEKLYGITSHTDLYDEISYHRIITDLWQNGDV